MNDQERTLFVGNLSSHVSEELIFELFLQAGPVENVTIPSKFGKQRNFGFVLFKHACSVAYAAALMDQIMLFGRAIIVKAQGRMHEQESFMPRDRLGPSEGMNDSLRGFTHGGGRSKRLDSHLRPSYSTKSDVQSEMEMIGSLPDSLSSMPAHLRNYNHPYSGRGSEKRNVSEKRRHESPSDNRYNSRKDCGDMGSDSWIPSKKHSRRNDDFIRDGSRDYLAPKHRGGGYRHHHSERSSHRRH